MNGLENEFSDEIDFIWLNADDKATLGARQAFNIVQRSRYVLVDENNQVVQRWFGPLNERIIHAQVADWLAGRSS